MLAAVLRVAVVVVATSLVFPVFARATAPSPSTSVLEGTTWKLVSVAGKPAVALPEGRYAKLAFAGDGRYAASAGCNSMGGTWKQTGNDLQFTLGPTTMMACGDPIATQEQDLMEALGATRQFRIKKVKRVDRLELIAEGKVLAVFEAVETE